jgi:hypothetical protein
VDVKSENWPAFQVERRKAADLKPYKNNARTHSKEQVAQIAASIREFGFTNPVLVDEADGVIAGHGRLEAAASLGVVEVPVIVARGWSQAQKRAYVLADNQLALNAGWDENLLSSEIAENGLLVAARMTFTTCSVEPACREISIRAFRRVNYRLTAKMNNCAPT